MDPITDSGGDPCVFRVGCSAVGGCWLFTDCFDADYVWDPGSVWVFGCCEEISAEDFETKVS